MPKPVLGVGRQSFGRIQVGLDNQNRVPVFELLRLDWL